MAKLVHDDRASLTRAVASDDLAQADEDVVVRAVEAGQPDCGVPRRPLEVDGDEPVDEIDEPPRLRPGGGDGADKHPLLVRRTSWGEREAPRALGVVSTPTFARSASAWLSRYCAPPSLPARWLVAADFPTTATRQMPTMT